MRSHRAIVPIRRRAHALAGAVVFWGAALLGLAAKSEAADPWLFVNDIHLNPTESQREPVVFGKDTNAALLASAIAEMQRVAPNPPVIVMAGDFLGHRFKSASALPTMQLLARQFDRAFPHAQFVFALGNEDADCGDYAVTADSPFLRAVATAWAPLVNRRGAAPDFARTFAHDGLYTARLPIRGLRAVVVNDTLWSPFYRNACGSGDPTPGSFAELDRALTPSSLERRWLVMHIPPGVDASSTVHLAKHLAIVPFLRPDPREKVLKLVADPARHVDLVVTGHVHRFTYRIVDATGKRPIPMLGSPAISPIFDNNSSFLTADVAGDGTIRNLEEHSRVRGTWRDVGGLQTLGVGEFTGPALVDLQRRLARDPDLRERYSALYLGGTRWREITEGNWRSYWCASTEFASTSFRDCLDEGGFGFLTRRGVAVVSVVGGIVLVVVLVAGMWLVRGRRVRRRHDGV